MIVYGDVVFLLNFLVDFLLLVGSNQLAGYSLCWKRPFLGALLGGLYGVLCLLKSFSFLGHLFWRIVCLGMISVISYGWNRNTFRRGILFSFLSMALGGIALNIRCTGFVGIIACAFGAVVLCFLGFRGKAGQETYIQVELRKNNKKKYLTALHDTGNTLKDPITGQQLLVVGPETAWDFFGLTQNQLRCPIETMSQAPVSGLQLIPYRAVGQSTGMLLALRFDEVKINGKVQGPLVAFAPEVIGKGEAYEALAGGIL